MTTINKILTAEMFKKHKKNRGTLCYSRFLSGVNNVRIVVDSGIDPHPGNITKKPSVSAVVVNSSGQWRTIVAGKDCLFKCVLGQGQSAKAAKGAKGAKVEPACDPIGKGIES